MAEDFDDKKQRAYVNRRAVMDLGMGIIYAGVSVFLIFSHMLFGVELEFPPTPFNYVFGGLCLLYGGFRIYRGIKKNYYQ